MTDRTRRPHGRRTRGAGIALLLTLGLVAVPASSTAHWAATTQVAQPSESAALVAAPGDSRCDTVVPGLLQPCVARLGWERSNENTTFEVWVSADANGTGRTLLATTSATTIDLSSSLLSGLLSTLLNLLLGGQPLYADVVAVHESGWRSEPTSAHPVSNDGLVGGLLGGIRCGT